MESNQEQDRTEQATPFKLREARRRGQVAKSLEINSLFVIGISLVLLYISGEQYIVQQLKISHNLLAWNYSADLNVTTIINLFASVAEKLVSIFWLFIGGIMVFGILANLIQVGPIFSFFPIKPDIQRINPVQGIKRFFSIKILYEGVKNIIKLVLSGSVITLFLISVIPSLFNLIDASPGPFAALLLDDMRIMLFQLLMVFLLVALIDAAYTRWEYNRQMRMSRRELKEEVKRREGDPQIKNRMRELQKEAVKRAGSLRKVPDADVLITNPTRLAVALIYKRGLTPAPQVIAKGAGELAAKMREVAGKNNVPIIENRKLAKKLFQQVEIEHYVPEELYPTVAKILVWAFSIKEQKQTKEQTI